MAKNLTERGYLCYYWIYSLTCHDMNAVNSTPQALSRPLKIDTLWILWENMEAYATRLAQDIAEKLSDKLKIKGISPDASHNLWLMQALPIKQNICNFLKWIKTNILDWDIFLARQNHKQWFLNLEWFIPSYILFLHELNELKRNTREIIDWSESMSDDVQWKLASKVAHVLIEDW